MRGPHVQRRTAHVHLGAGDVGAHRKPLRDRMEAQQQARQQGENHLVNDSVCQPRSKCQNGVLPGMGGGGGGAS